MAALLLQDKIYIMEWETSGELKFGRFSGKLFTALSGMILWSGYCSEGFYCNICYLTVKTVKVIESDIYVRTNLDLRMNLSHSDEAGIRFWKTD